MNKKRIEEAIEIVWRRYWEVLDPDEAQSAVNKHLVAIRDELRSLTNNKQL